MRAGERRHLWASLGYLVATASGLDHLQRSSFAEEFAEQHRRTADMDMAGTVGYALRVTARELERLPDLTRLAAELAARDERRTRAFTEANRRTLGRGEHHRHRARELHEDPARHSRRKIGEIIAREEGRERAYSVRQVDRWLERNTDSA